eukprot:2301568-Pleurochrysis_carterae.AAC.2
MSEFNARFSRCALFRNNGFPEFTTHAQGDQDKTSTCCTTTERVSALASSDDSVKPDHQTCVLTCLL